jgi:hypothetical protein
LQSPKHLICLQQELLVLDRPPGCSEVHALLARSARLSEELPWRICVVTTPIVFAVPTQVEQTFLLELVEDAAPIVELQWDRQLAFAAGETLQRFERLPCVV